MVTDEEDVRHLGQLLAVLTGQGHGAVVLVSNDEVHEAGPGGPG